MDRDDDKPKPKEKPKALRKDERSYNRRENETAKLSEKKLPAPRLSSNEMEQVVEKALFGETPNGIEKNIADKMTPKVFGTLRESQKYSLASDIAKEVARIYRGDAPAVSIEGGRPSGLYGLSSDPRAQPLIVLARNDINSLENFAATLGKALFEALRVQMRNDDPLNK